MDGPNRKLVVLLCMHRSGSSLTANILQKLGLSLGPFELIEAAPSNPYGHFEAIPFHSLNRRVQEWAFGFADDIPDEPAVLARFLESQGEWPTDRLVPEHWLDEGEHITRLLIESGPVSGFKDPRTVLVWPFWRQVFSRFQGVDVVASSLLRSPHEIAMSLCTRSQGSMSYWNALDVVGVHLSRMKAASDEESRSLVVRFGTPAFWEDMQELADACGLPWCEDTVRRLYDQSCVHHLPAVVAHQAQDTLNALGREAWIEVDPEANAQRIARDARRYEAAMHGQLKAARAELGKTIVLLREAERNNPAERIHDLEHRAALAEHGLATTRQALNETEKAFLLAKSCLEQTEKQLCRVMEYSVSNQERRVQAEQLLAHTQGILAHKEQALLETQRRLAESLDRQERSLKLFQQALATSQGGWDSDRTRLEVALDQAAKLQETATRKEQQLVRSLEREEKRWQENVALRRRLDRFESNALIGAAVKGKRQIKQIWLKFRHLGPNGEPRSSRVDRPI
ncbi:hypothetical protein [Paludisphaera soli]|uniref:hypothetical protein n=1 Tax=Paludisphaera soli TaxID=2712865 RepID=UPI0013EB1067|nr:hypothetical protein [Paludisphaera soli]